MFGRDKRWKHLSAKPRPRLNTMDSCKTTRLIGSRCTHSNVLSQWVLIHPHSFRSHGDGYFRSVCGVSTTIIFFIVLSDFLVIKICLTHLFPFRTEQCKRISPMILFASAIGKVGFARNSLKKIKKFKHLYEMHIFYLNLYPNLSFWINILRPRSQSFIAARNGIIDAR